MRPGFLAGGMNTVELARLPDDRLPEMIDVAGKSLSPSHGLVMVCPGVTEAVPFRVAASPSLMRPKQPLTR
jgi:hypothetical protein